MSTKIDEDYERLKNKNPEDFEQNYNQEEREARRLLKSRITIRIDDDILEEFKSIAPEGKGYQSLINQALREWLDAKGVKELVEKQVEKVVGEAISSIREVATSSKQQ